MEKTYEFTYLSEIKHEGNDKESSIRSISDDALEAKWRVIEYILKKLLIKTD